MMLIKQNKGQCLRSKFYKPQWNQQFVLQISFSDSTFPSKYIKKNMIAQVISVTACDK